MRGHFVVHLTCPACGREGVIDAAAAVRRLVAGARPARFRCDRRAGGCGFSHPPEAVTLIIAWDGAATPEEDGA